MAQAAVDRPQSAASTSQAGQDRRRNSKQSQHTSKRMSTSSAGRDESKMIGQWRIGRTIGKGSSGRVKIAKHAITGKYAAIKIVPKGLILTSRMSMSEAGARADKVLLGIEREIVIMKLIDHPNVLNLYDVWETSGELYLIMEYVPGGELFDYLVKRGRLPLSEALHYFQQIIHAVDYCHRFNICHRDLKPENLLLDKDKNIKVADFGMAAWEAGERMLETSCGSPHYASPEIVAGRAYHGSSSDIWSCGIILFALITGRLPFDDDNIRVLLLKVKAGVFEMPSEVQGTARDLLSRMLEKEPEKRITMPEILSHPFFVSRPPRVIPGRPLVSPPSLDEVECPISSPHDVDPDIMGNLKTLWHGASDDEIISALLSKEKTWEKAIYHLLVKYRNKHLENYNVDEEEQQRARRQVSASSNKQHDSLLAAPSYARPHGRDAGPEVLADVKDRPSSPIGHPARPQAPTPTKAQGAARGMDQAPSDRAARLQAQRAAPAGPRPPLSPRPSSLMTGGNDQTGYAQSLTVVVEPEDEEQSDVKRYYDEITQQLESMSVRDSVMSNGSAYNGAPLHSPMEMYPSSPAQDADSSRFADAEEDDTDMMSVHSGAPSTAVHPTSRSPVLGLGIEGARPTLDEVSHNWGPSFSSMMSQSTTGAGPSRQSSYAESASVAPAPTRQAVNFRPAPPPPPRIPPPAITVTPLSESTLGRDNSYVYIDMEPASPNASWKGSFGSRNGAHSIISSWTDTSKLKRKKTTPSSDRPMPFSPDLSGSSNNGAKRSWFQNLFNFKPSPYTLWSYESIAATEQTIQKALLSYGARVAVERLEGQVVLRCRWSGSKDISNGSSKVIQFKIEILRAAPPTRYQTGVNMSLTKGAQSAFKEIHGRLRQDYRLDTSRNNAPSSVRI